MDSRAKSTISLVILVVLAGCAGLGSVTSEEQLAADPPSEYQWDAEANTSITIENGYYLAVYRIDGQTDFRFHRSTAYGDDRPISMRSVQFRYPNGTVVNTSEIDVHETRSGVHVSLPTDQGQFAYTGSHRSRNFDTGVYVSGSHEIILPASYHVENLILGTVRPGGYETDRVDDRLRLRWDSVGSSTIIVRYYRERDVTLFTSLVIIASTVAAGALLYVFRQVQELRRRREGMGLDIDISDDDRRRPPPGMR